MATAGALVDAGRRLIGSPSLPDNPSRLIVAALLAKDGDGGKCPLD
ncbi:uncharacterized protein METZ01_LOCUS3175 [marine metagenome]|uniref:Uncharacterized protein n=1 Tax=marine metagenome TaxID=408172 RepID=A0A381N6S7_9ZZZZ